jgi:hypothetical protein
MLKRRIQKTQVCLTCKSCGAAIESFGVLRSLIILLQTGVASIMRFKTKFPMLHCHFAVAGALPRFDQR